MERVPLAERETVEALEGVHLTQLATGEGMSVQHFRIEPGAVVPEHEHPHEQAGWVESGEGVFMVGSGAQSALEQSSGEPSDPRDVQELVVGAGDSYTIPGEEPHAVEVRGDEPLVGVDIFHPPRENPDWAE